MAQAFPEPVHIREDAPAYMQILNRPLQEVNVNEAINAYDVYYRTHPFDKNEYTQYYKRYVKWARPYMKSDGKLYIPTLEEDAEFERQALSYRKSTDRMANWTFAGPNKTYDTNGLTKVTWQTNLYSIDIAASNANVLFAGGEDGGMWKTTDKGLNWTLTTRDISHGAFSSIKIDPTIDQVVYAGTSGKLIKSINQGITWATSYTESGLTVYEISVSSNNPSIVLAATNKGVIRSVNGGSSWTKLFTSFTWTIKPKEGSGTTFYAIRDAGNSSEFIKSTDSGATWTAYNTGWWTPAAGEAMTGGIIATCPTNASKIYAYLIGSGTNLYGYAGVWVSNDDGLTWTNTNPTNLIGHSPTAYSIPSHTNLMANNGITGFNQGFYDMAIVVNPLNENQLIAGGTSWFKSIDGGVTWTTLGGYVSGLAWSHPDIQWLTAKGSDLWIASDGGINYSTNFGQTMETRMDGVSGSNMWGFDSGWNEDILVGGRYHNGNMGFHQSFPQGSVYRLGGAESATGYVNPGPERKVYHSDIGGKIIKPGFGNGVTNFGVGAWPNESYAYYANSEMVFHPFYYNTVFLGKDNKLLKSTDGGTNFDTLYFFPGTVDNKVYDIEISRSNPQVMYCSQWDGTDDAIWRSANGGLSWVKVTALPLPNNNDRVKLALSSTNENILWVTVSYGSDGKKIYKTVDGGQSWINLTTSLLNGIRISNIMAQYGTDGGIYLGTNAGVFYRNNSHADWQPYSTGLPVSTETNRLKPFYKDGKIRNGCWGFGVWESPLFEASAIEALPMTAAAVHPCKRDTVNFDDLSVVNHTGASWSWTFPGATWVSSTTVRNPRVLYSNEGSFNVSMTVINGANSSSRTVTNMVTVSDGCKLDTVPGKALYCSGSNKHAINASLNLPATDSFTVTAWVKPNGIQSDYSAIWMNETGDAGGFNFKNGNNSLAYHWPGGQWWWNSGLIVTPNVWNFVAMVVKPTGITLYCNESIATHNIMLTPLNINGFRIGNYKGWGDRNVNGYIDEVAVYNRVLSTVEIRDLRHLVKHPENDLSLVSYYQFNENTGYVAFDKARNHHCTLYNGASRIVSRIPVGEGVSDRLTLNSAGLKNFSDSGVKMYFPNSATYPNGEVVVTRINQLPDTLPQGLVNPTCYWVANNYGTNAVFTALDSIRFHAPGNTNSGCDSYTYKLKKRPSNSEGLTWTDQDEADLLFKPDIVYNAGNATTSLGQMIIQRMNDYNRGTEYCNGEDDDCDGLVDEDAYLYVTSTQNSGLGSLRQQLTCLQNGDTIFFAPNLDTIRLTEPLTLDKQMWWWGNGINSTRIKMDMSLPAFSNVSQGILFTPQANATLKDLALIQRYNTLVVPFIKNAGILELRSCHVKGNVATRLVNQPGGQLKTEGSTEIR
ncbi:MAG: PKD domain-containing protein [Saprospiraceae bacterium]|nr:PKD domain-containing protein [Saprospiraceae bacterium]